MKTTLFLTLALAFAGAAYAAPADDVAAAAQKLADAPNYSFTTTTEIASSQFPAMPMEGMIEKNGYSVTTVSFNGNTLQTVRKGNQMVTQNRDGAWMTAEEMRAQFANGGGGRQGGNGKGNGGGNGGGRGGQGGGGGGRGGFGMFGGGQADHTREVSDLAGKVKDAKLVHGAIVGTLSSEDAAARLTFGGGRGGRGGRGGQGGQGQTPPAPKNASGTVKFWLKDGAIEKYAINVKGTISTPNGDDREIDRTTTTEFKNIGTTKVVVPDEAKAKLSS